MPKIILWWCLLALLSCHAGHKRVEPRIMRIGLIRLGNGDVSELSAVAKAIGSFYGSEVVILESTTLPEQAYYSARKRYKADSLLILEKIKPENIDKIVGITTSDISTSIVNSDDWGVFGLATLGGESCVTSTFRLRKGNNRTVIAERLQKVALHEMGHTFGLDHCGSGSMDCLMRDGEGKLKKVDEEQFILCEECGMHLSN